MNTIAEKQPLHSIASELQPWHIGAFIGLGVCAVNPKMIIWVLITAGVGYMVWRKAERERIARENAARLSAIVNHCAPIVVATRWITEDVNSVMERVAQIKQDLKDSGNQYADIIPVIPFPYSPMLFEVGQLAMSWAIYERMVGEQRHMENLKWYEGNICPANLKAIFASQVMPAPKQTFAN